MPLALPGLCVIADYMFPLDGETADQLAERLLNDFEFARGGNHPSLVARYRAENTVEQRVANYLELWGQVAEDEDYVPATPEQIADAAVELYEDDDGE